MKVYIFFLIILMQTLTGCVNPQLQQIQREIQDTTPICESDDECEVMWSKARSWVLSNAGFKIQNYSSDYFDTYNPTQHSPLLAAQVSKDALGNGRYKIVAKLWCNNIFGCQPNQWQALLNFNKYVDVRKEREKKYSEVEYSLASIPVRSKPDYYATIVRYIKYNDESIKIQTMQNEWARISPIGFPEEWVLYEMLPSVDSKRLTEKSTNNSGVISNLTQEVTPTKKQSKITLVEAKKELQSTIEYKLKDASSAKLKNLKLDHPSQESESSYIICGIINSKNSYGAYTGYKRFAFSKTDDDKYFVVDSEGKGPAKIMVDAFCSQYDLFKD